jgi:hypothetical protein
MLIIQTQVPIKEIKVALNALALSLQRLSRLKEGSPVKEMLMKHEQDAFKEISKWLEGYEKKGPVAFDRYDTIGVKAVKIEIEITEQEIKDAVERKVRVAIADQTNKWAIDDYIKAEVKKKIPQVIDILIDQCLTQHDSLKAKIIEEIEKSLTSKVQAALKLKAA